MPRLVAIDSGPLVGLFSRDDVNHQAARRFFRSFKDQGFTTVPVITEVMYLLDFRVDVQLDFLRWLRRGAFSIVDLDAGDWDRIADLHQKYGDRVIDLADSSLVAACERLKTRLVATVDSDFDIYRWRGNELFVNVFESYRWVK